MDRTAPCIHQYYQSKLQQPTYSNDLDEFKESGSVNKLQPQCTDIKK
jgi:hypothetical protein